MKNYSVKEMPDDADALAVAFSNGVFSERRRIVALLTHLHEKAQPYHNYYRHAVVALNLDEDIVRGKNGG